jgi:hypothetical protein
MSLDMRKPTHRIVRRQSAALLRELLGVWISQSADGSGIAPRQLTPAPFEKHTHLEEGRTMTTDQVAPRPPHGEPAYAAPYGQHSSLPEPVTAPIEGEWVPPADGWAGAPAGGAPPAAPATTGNWTGKKVIAAVALTAALAGGAGFGIGMAVESGSSSSTQQGGPGSGQFPGGGNGGPGGGFGNQQDGTGTTQQGGTGTTQQGGTGTTQQGGTGTTQQGGTGTTQQGGTAQQGTVPDGSTSTT